MRTDQREEQVTSIPSCLNTEVATEAGAGGGMTAVVVEERNKSKDWEEGMRRVSTTEVDTQQGYCTTDTAGPEGAGAEETHMSDVEAAEVGMPNSLVIAPTTPDSDSALDFGPCSVRDSYCPSRFPARASPKEVEGGQEEAQQVRRAASGSRPLKPIVLARPCVSL